MPNDHTKLKNQAETFNLNTPEGVARALNVLNTTVIWSFRERDLLVRLLERLAQDIKELRNSQ